MSEMAERLREIYGTHPLVVEAADRIEALEEWDHKRAQDIITLGFMIGELKATLEDIERSVGSRDYIQGLARAALEDISGINPGAEIASD